VLVVALVPLALVFSRFERPGKARGDLPAAWRLVVGALTVSFGMAFLALGGVAGEGWLGLNLWVIAMPIAGAALMRRWTGRARSA
jgi:Flp pilus assembly protein TadB